MAALLFSIFKYSGDITGCVQNPDDIYSILGETVENKNFSKARYRSRPNPFKFLLSEVRQRTQTRLIG